MTATDPLRLLFVSENIGGHSTMHRHLAECLPAHPDISASFFHVPPPGLLRKIASAPLPGLGRLDADLHVLRSQLVVSAMIRRELDRRRREWDVLHAYTHNGTLLSTATLAAGPSVVTLDGTSLDCSTRLPHRYPTVLTPWTSRPGIALERRVYQAATFVVAKSEWARRSLTENYQLPDDKLRVIPLGIKLPSTTRGGPPAGRPRITFVGRTLDRKGGLRLLHLWRRALADVATLTMVTAERLPSEPGLEVRNDVTAGDGRLDAILADTTVLAFPSEVDAFGYAPLEAMAAGVPVVATDNAAAPELVGEGGDAGGLVVPLSDDRALVEALRVLITDPTLNERLGRAARTRVAKRFDAKITTAALVETVHDAVARFRSLQLPREVVGDDVELSVRPASRRASDQSGKP